MSDKDLFEYAYERSRFPFKELFTDEDKGLLMDEFLLLPRIPDPYFYAHYHALLPLTEYDCPNINDTNTVQSLVEINKNCELYDDTNTVIDLADPYKDPPLRAASIEYHLNQLKNNRLSAAILHHICNSDYLARHAICVQVAGQLLGTADKQAEDLFLKKRNILIENLIIELRKIVQIHDTSTDTTTETTQTNIVTDGSSESGATQKYNVDISKIGEAYNFCIETEVMDKTVISNVDFINAVNNADFKNIYNSADTKNSVTKCRYLIFLMSKFMDKEWYAKAAHSIDTEPNKCSGANVSTKWKKTAHMRLGVKI